MARSHKADIFISLHINSSTSASANGAEIYVSNNKSLDKYYKNTAALSEQILSRLSSLGIKNNGVKTRLIPSDETDIYSDGTRADYYGVIRYAMRGTMIDSGKVSVLQDGQKVKVDASKSAKVQNGEGIPTILIEHCYIIGSDFNFVNSDEKIKKLAKADSDGIVAYYGLKLKQAQTQIENVIVDETNMIARVTPNTTVSTIIKQLGSTNYYLTDASGNKIEKKNEKLATGYTINILKEDNTIDKTDTIIKAGDVNGDSEVDVIDLALMKRHLMGTQTLKDSYYKAGIIQKDSKEIDVIELALLKRYLIGTTTINLK